MVLFLLYKTVPDDELRKDAGQGIEGIKKWFEEHPKRRVCHAEMFYGKMISVRKKHIEEDVNKGLEAALKQNKERAARQVPSAG